MERIPKGTDSQEKRLFYPEDDQVILYFLTPSQVQIIDRMLTNTSPYAEIRLVKERGFLKFMQVLESYRFISNPL
jgi:hypothetical protein